MDKGTGLLTATGGSSSFRPHISAMQRIAAGFVHSERPLQGVQQRSGSLVPLSGKHAASKQPWSFMLTPLHLDSRYAPAQLET